MDREPSPATSESQVLPHWHSPGSDILSIVHGEGVTVYDEADEEYLDFLSQLYCCNAGHDNEAIIEAMVEQARKIPFVSPAKHNDTRS